MDLRNSVSQLENLKEYLISRMNQAEESVSGLSDVFELSHFF